VPYLLLGLQDVQWAVGNSRGARKLARTPHVNQKKKKILITSKKTDYKSPIKAITNKTISLKKKIRGRVQ
jgi:hypothetical protein